MGFLFLFDSVSFICTFMFKSISYIFVVPFVILPSAFSSLLLDPSSLLKELSYFIDDDPCDSHLKHAIKRIASSSDRHTL